MIRGSGPIRTHPCRKSRIQCVYILVVLASMLLFPSLSVANAQEGLSEGASIHTVAWGETLLSIAAHYGVTVQSIIDANRLVEPDRIYAGQQLVIPHAGASALGLSHVVQPGETLFGISRRYGVSLEYLAAANGLAEGDTLYAEQILVIPTSSETDSAPASTDSALAVPPADGLHLVAQGETLSSIGRAYGVSLASLVAVNNLLNPSLIYPGQQIIIPGGSGAAASTGYSPAESSVTHVVSAGETLNSIAARYGTSVWVLSQANSISNPSLVYAGQVLTIPASGALSEMEAASLTGKHIVVDISEQRTYVYENNSLLWTFVVSTGMPGSDTWRGEFRIQNKIPNAYASTWSLQMPYWLGFYWAGSLQNGFHALPILSNGTRLWEGLLGRPASYGCVILSDHDAQLLYAWADIGTPVTVQN